ncbi:MAG: helix-turn-helix domain-containing protein, partial [Pirellulaceae bacterium]|nr:helix-turn-helix domain-containing protein [Pirellulaceae bacterium]
MEPTQSKEWTWFRVPARLSDVLPTIGRAVSVYLVLARHADIDGQCFPSHATIATAAGISERSVRDHLAILNCAGLVTWKRRRRESDLYTLPDLAALKNGNTLPVKDPKNGNGLPFKSDKNGKGLPVKRPTAAKNGKNSQQERQKCVVKNGENSPPKYTSEGEPVKEKIDHLDVVLKNAREASGEPSEWERADARLQGWIKRGQLPRL